MDIPEVFLRTSALLDTLYCHPDLSWVENPGSAVTGKWGKNGWGAPLTFCKILELWMLPEITDGLFCLGDLFWSEIDVWLAK